MSDKLTTTMQAQLDEITDTYLANHREPVVTSARNQTTQALVRRGRLEVVSGDDATVGVRPVGLPEPSVAERALKVLNRVRGNRNRTKVRNRGK